MIHPDTRLIYLDESVGYGVIATRPIGKGSIVWVKDDLDIQIEPGDPIRKNRLYRDLIEKYSYSEADETLVLCWDIAKFINHSCSPSTLGAGWGTFNLAVRDILPGEQVTDDYTSYGDFPPFQCECGSPDCREVVRSSDFEGKIDDMDRTLEEVIKELPTQPQPLLDYLGPEVLADLKRFVDTGEGYRSVRFLKT